MSFLDRGSMCKRLIVINVVVFIIQLVTEQTVVENFRSVSSGPFTDFFVLDPNLVLHGQFWRLLTYSFLHDPSSIWHILFNMLFLWWFGSEVEDMAGPREFLAFYLVAAVLGGMLFTLTWLVGRTGGVCLGASGAVTAVMVVYACHFPRRVILIWFVLPVPIWLFVGFQVAQDSFSFFRGDLHSTVAVSVHVAGAAFGYLYYRMQWRVLSLWSGWNNWRRQQRQPRLRVYRAEEPARIAASKTAESNEQLEAKLDAVLEKVAQFGQSSLTDQERTILLQASEIYKRKRT